MSLPSGYTQLEYIESHGTEYFDTGFVPNSNTRVVMDVENLATNTKAFFGARTTSSTYAYVVFVTAATTLRSDYCSATKSQETITLTSALGRYTIDKNKNVCTANGVTVTNTELEFECAYNLYLIANNNKGAVANIASVKLYSCQIYDNDTLIRDYIPCLNASGTVGLWDDVNSVFYENAGTGTFDYYLSKKHKTRIDGTGYETKSGRTRIDGTGYSIKKGRTLIDGTGYDIGFEVPAGELDIGTSVYMNVDGVRTEFLVVHQGTRSTSQTNSATADGTWVMIKDIYTLSVYGSSWPYTDKPTVAKYCINTFPGLLDSDILSLFQTVTIKAQYSSWSDLDCNFFIPSAAEITGSNAFDYFNGAEAAKRIAYYNDVATAYWTRTAGSSGSSSDSTTPYVAIINEAGKSETKWNDMSSAKRGVRPVGVLSAEAIIDGDFNIIIP